MLIVLLLMMANVSNRGHFMTCYYIAGFPNLSTRHFGVDIFWGHGGAGYLAASIASTH